MSYPVTVHEAESHIHALYDWPTELLGPQHLASDEVIIAVGQSMYQYEEGRNLMSNAHWECPAHILTMQASETRAPEQISLRLSSTLAHSLRLLLLERPDGLVQAEVLAELEQAGIS